MAVIFGASSPELVECDVTGGVDSTRSREINEVTALASNIRTQINAGATFGSEFVVFGFFEESLNRAAPDFHKGNVWLRGKEEFMRSGGCGRG